MSRHAEKAENQTADKAAGKHIPDAPNSPAVTRDIKPEAPTTSERNDGFTFDQESGRTDHGADKFGAGGGQTGAGSGEAVPSLAPSAIPEGSGESDDRLQWTDEVNRRGRVISVSLGTDGPTTTREEVLPAHATDEEAGAAKQRLRTLILR